MGSDTELADAGAREEALAPDRSFIVQAPAGSGKTTLLTHRVLRLLAIVDQPEEVVAITFTRKAAAEMRNRILGALDAARGPRPQDPAVLRTWQLASAVLARNDERSWNLTDSPERLRIGTIDAFCAALARQMPVLSGLGVLPEVVENAQDLYREAAQALFAHLETDGPASAAVERLLRHLDNNLPRAVELVAAMLGRRDQWMRHLGGGAEPQRAVIEKGLARVVQDALAALRTAIPQDAVPEMLWLARYAAHNLKLQDGTSPVCCCGDLETLPPPLPADVEIWRGLQSLLMTDGGDWRRRVDIRQGFPAAGAGSSAEQTLRKDAKRRYELLIGRLRDVHGLGERLALLSLLPPPQYTDAQWAVVEALCVLLPLAVAELLLIFGRRQQADFTQIAWSALQSLGRPGEPTDLALVLDYRIRHLLIDEFQDTSVSQFELVETLTAGWEPDDGRTLFVVGDPMQSIYRFRQAEVGLFLRAWRRGIGGVRLKPLALSVNFRSQKGIVDWVNSAFASLFPSQEDIATGAVTYSPSVAWHAQRGAPAVVVHPAIGRDDVAEAQAVTALIAQATADDGRQTIAVLVRSRNHLVEIAPRLRAAGLRFRAVEIEALGHRSVVQDLLALTRALAHPADRLSWLALLRAPWCGLVLEDLERLVGADHITPVWELLCDSALCSTLSGDGRERLGRLRDVLVRYLPRVGHESLRRCVEGAWISVGGPACCADSTDLADALVYLDLLEECGAGGEVPELVGLSEEVDRLFALPDLGADEHLQLMTIHKAKGLEFDIVIVPGLGRIPRVPDPPLLAWAERPDASTGGADLLLAPIRASGSDSDSISGYLKSFERRRGTHEDGRLLYVAATRAREQLHLFGHTALDDQQPEPRLKLPDRRSLLHQLWPALQAEYERTFTGRNPCASRPGPAPDEARSPVLLRRLPLAWKLPGPPPPVNWTGGVAPLQEVGVARVEFDWARETIRHVGSVIHALLQQIGREGIQAWSADRVRALRPLIAVRLAQAGVPPPQIDVAVRRSEAGLLGVLADERGRWILDPGHQDARCEYALSANIEGALRNVVLDRTFVDAEGQRWIIDYKTSAHEGSGVDEFLDRERERYRPQLERYAQILGRMDPRPQRLGLYFPLMRGWREWSPGADAPGTRAPGPLPADAGGDPD